VNVKDLKIEDYFEKEGSLVSKLMVEREIRLK
jgi:hypothetical protein